MSLQIFVEDQLNEAYEVLARKALGISIERHHRRDVKASIAKINDLTTTKGLFDLVTASHEAGYDCIIFILDQEASEDRIRKVEEFKRAFNQLCDDLSGLPEDHELKSVNVIRIVCKSCLESWLLSDTQAVIDAVRGGHGISYNPPQQNTENLTPKQALDQIVHLIHEVGKRMGKKDLLRFRSNNVKSKGKSIAQYVDPARARRSNRTLAYFFDMVDCRRHGCEHPCPE